MLKFVIALAVVVAVTLGGLMAFRQSSRLPMPSQDVLDRVKIRERELEEQDRLERED